MIVFSQGYAQAYDALYREKDYPGECDMIEALIAEHGTVPGVKRIVDFGCGTANHVIPLALRGYYVSGVDVSEAMLAKAREKAAANGVGNSTCFYHGDVRTVRLDIPAQDAGIMMFAVLGYQQQDSDVLAALRTARSHLASGAALVFDVWYGPGVLADRPGPRERVVETSEGRIVRRTNTILEEDRHLCTVHFDLERWYGDRVERTSEDHVMRYFFPEELERFATDAGFELQALRDFPNWCSPVTPTSWNTVGILRAA